MEGCSPRVSLSGGNQRLLLPNSGIPARRNHAHPRAGVCCAGIAPCEPGRPESEMRGRARAQPAHWVRFLPGAPQPAPACPRCGAGEDRRATESTWLAAAPAATRRNHRRSREPGGQCSKPRVTKQLCRGDREKAEHAAHLTLPGPRGVQTAVCRPTRKLS